MTPGPARPARIGAGLALLALALAGPVRANVEEFSTFSIAPQERDDESVLDHYLTRMPAAWRDEWARASAGFRTSQGCLTSGRWFVDTDFRARAPLGQRAWLGVELRESDSDILNTRDLDLSFHFPQPVGTAFAVYRPLPTKAEQDFGIGWEGGADTSAVHVRFTWMIEDIFNRFAGYRQTQIGDRLEPYERRPYEPAVALAIRQPDWRIEMGGKWLTPSRKRITDLGETEVMFRRELWGATGYATAEKRFGAATFEVRSDHRQARVRETPGTVLFVEHIDWRRQWSLEGAARLRFSGGRSSLQARWLYQSRTEYAGPPVGSAYLQTDDRLIDLDFTREIGSRFEGRIGAMLARIGVARANPTDFSFGTRSESRLYLGLAMRAGRVRIAGIEGVELDDEPYDVRLVHDKGFVQLQTTF